MTYYDVYLGDVNDPDFKWEGGDWNGNVPKRISPFFKDAFWPVINKINIGEFKGKQTDWGGWTAYIS